MNREEPTLAQRIFIRANGPNSTVRQTWSQIIVGMRGQGGAVPGNGHFRQACGGTRSAFRERIIRQDPGVRQQLWGLNWVPLSPSGTSIRRLLGFCERILRLPRCSMSLCWPLWMALSDPFASGFWLNLVKKSSPCLHSGMPLVPSALPFGWGH